MKWEQFIVNTFDVQQIVGDEFVCHCPWHNDTGKPNLYINGVKGTFFCHACGEKGHLSKLDGAVSMSSVADIRAQIKKYKHPDPPPKVHPEQWLMQFALPHDAWIERGFSQQTIDEFQLGYDPMMNVLTIPFRNDHGDLLGVVTRRLDNEKPKYRYPKGVALRQLLFGAWRLEGRNKVALCEGPLDAIACWNARVPALGMFGSSLSRQQETLLHRLGIKHVIIFTDNDLAGEKARHQIKATVRGIRLSVAIYRPYWDAKDPGDLSPARIRKAFHSAKSWHDVA